VAGVLIGKLGTGPVFLLNALSFCAVLAALALLRKEELHRPAVLASTTSGLVDGFRYVWRRRDLAGAMLMLFLVGTLGLNFPVYISTMSVSVFRRGAEGFGLLTSMMAVGSVIGALLSARRELPRASLLASSAAVFGIGLALAALSGSYLTFGLLLAVTGVAAQTFTTTANSTVQLGTEPAMRGRVMAIFMAIAMGTTPLGAPLVGWVADTFGPRFGLLVGAMGGLSAALVGFALSRQRARVANA
jgi:MFS family permease